MARRAGVTTRAEVLREAWCWLGTPWAHQTMARGRFCDCAGLVKGVGLASGALAPGALEDPALADYRGYTVKPCPRDLLAGLGVLLVPEGRVVPGNVGLFLVDGAEQHLGIITRVAPAVYVLHAYNKPGVRRVVESRVVGPRYMRRVWRYPLVEGPA